MEPLETGSDVVSARNTLGLKQNELASALDISVATLRKHESSHRLDTMLSLAVECLLRRASRTAGGLSPEERAERDFRKLIHLRRLKEEAGILPASKRMTPLEVVARKDAIHELKILRARNRMREEERAIVAAQHATMKRLFAEAVATGDRAHYDAEILSACSRFGSRPMVYLSDYIDAAKGAPPADASPLVTLPLEPEA